MNHSFYPTCWRGGVNAFEQFYGRGGVDKIFFGGGLDGKGGSLFEAVFRVFRDSNYTFYITTLI